MMWLGIHWESLQYAWILPIILLVSILYLYRQHNVNVIIQIIAGKFQRIAMQNYFPYKQHIKLILFLMGLLFLFVALLRPQWNKRNEAIAQKGRDVLIALDISRSMLAADCMPNRLECAKKKIKQLLVMLACERVGLILFSGSAFVQCPLTSDYASFNMFLDQVDVETISSGTTALDAALRQAIDSFRALPERKSKVCIVFTDGEDFSSNLRTVKHEVVKDKLRIFTIGVGTIQGAPIPLYDEGGKPMGHQKDSRGNAVISHLNDGILHTLAQDAGGVYVPITQDKSDLKQIVDRISLFEKDDLEDKMVASFEDTYHYFLALSLFCFALEWIL